MAERETSARERARVILSGGTPHRKGDQCTAADLVWEKVLDYAWYAVRHNWTPEQVDALPEFYSDRLPDYHRMLDEIHNEESQRADRATRARQRAGR